MNKTIRISTVHNSTYPQVGDLLFVGQNIKMLKNNDSQVFFLIRPYLRVAAERCKPFK